MGVTIFVWVCQIYNPVSFNVPKKKEEIPEMRQKGLINKIHYATLPDDTHSKYL